MRRLAAAIGIALTLTLAHATPAFAHHTHSPTTMCSTYRPSGYTMLTPHSHYSLSGHPTLAHCYYRNNVTFQTIQTCREYTSHYLMALRYCGHG